MNDEQIDYGPFVSHVFDGLETGPRIIVLGAVHGDELCGHAALRQVIDEIETGSLHIRSGRLTCIPIVNNKAFRNGRREGDRNLNRNLKPIPTPICYEDRIANILCPLLAAHDVLIDLHSFSAQGEPFVFVGPENNEEPLQPFHRASEELRLAMSLGLNRMVYGWLDAYDEFVTRQNAFLENVTRDSDVAIPMITCSACGTTEYMRAMGGYGVTVECGNHRDPNSIVTAYKVVGRALAHFGMVNTNNSGPEPFRDSVKVSHIFLREHREDCLTEPWKPFSLVQKGDVLACGPNGYVQRAPSDGFVIFAHPNAKLGEDWIHFGTASVRGVETQD